MTVNYEIHEIENVAGSGKTRRFVRIHHNQTLSASELEEAIEHSCTATKADVRSVMAAIVEVAQRQLASGNRFYLPGIGWFSVGAGLIKEAQEPGHKVTGKDIYPSGIQFQPEEKFYQKTIEGMSFRQSPFTTKSKAYDEEELWQLVDSYLAEHDYITRSQLQSLTGLSKYMTEKWLTQFVGEGLLREGGTRNHKLYFKSNG